MSEDHDRASLTKCVEGRSDSEGHKGHWDKIDLGLECKSMRLS